MQEITSPNGYRVKNIQPRTMHLTDGHTSYPHVLYHPLDTCKNSQIPNHPYQKHQCRRDANQRNVEIGRSKQMKEKSPVGARYPEETGKNTGLQQTESIKRSDTTVPKDLEKDTLSNLAKIPHRETSPIRGTTRLAA